MKNIVTNNIGLKLLALFLAVLTWYYIAIELNKGAIEERDALKSILPYKMISRQVPIKLDLRGEPSKGYAISYGKITINPPVCVIIGPESLIGGLTHINTQSIDISGYTRPFKREVSITSPVSGISIKEKFVKVAIPIIKEAD